MYQSENINRFIIEEDYQGKHVTMPKRKSLYGIFRIITLLFAYYMVNGENLILLFQGKGRVTFFEIICMFFILQSLLLTLWSFFVKEILIIETDNLIIRKQLWWFKGDSAYKRKNIANLHITHSSTRYKKAGICFNYFNKKVSFGSQLKIPELQYLLNVVLKDIKNSYDYTSKNTVDEVAAHSSSMSQPKHIYSSKIRTRYTIKHNTNGQANIIIPAKKNKFAIVFFSIWLTGWSFGELIVFFHIISGSFQLLLWWVFWTFGGALALKVYLWLLFGKEIVTVDNNYLVIERNIKFWSKKSKYLIKDISNIHYNDYHNKYKNNMVVTYGASGGNIHFYYHNKVVTFGSCLNQQEVEYLLNNELSMFKK